MAADVRFAVKTRQELRTKAEQQLKQVGHKLSSQLRAEIEDTLRKASKRELRIEDIRGDRV